MMDRYTDSKTVLDAGMMISSPSQPDPKGHGIPYVIRPNDSKLESLEPLLQNPARIRQGVNLHDPDSFINYVKSFREPGTRIFFDQDAGSFTAILDYHEAGGDGTEVIDDSTVIFVNHEARWCEHTAKYAPKETCEWAAWKAMNNKPMRQTDFAAFVENHVDDLADGYGTTLLKIALTLEIKKDVTFVSHQRQQDGSVTFRYEEDVQGSAQLGQFTIPPSFKLEIQPYVGGPMYQVDCRFRFRLQDRTVQLWYEIVKPEKLIEQAMSKIRTAIEEGVNLPVLAGAIY